MVHVGTRELKNRLSHFLRLVRAGARLVVTDHGRPVAELGPVSRSGKSTEDAWAQAAAEGWVTLPKRRRFVRFRPVRLPKGVTLSEAVIEDRR